MLHVNNHIDIFQTLKHTHLIYMVYIYIIRVYTLYITTDQFEIVRVCAFCSFAKNIHEGMFTHVSPILFRRSLVFTCVKSLSAKDSATQVHAESLLNYSS